MAGGMPRSALGYDGRDPFKTEELKETLNLDKFERGRRTYNVYKRGKLYCKCKEEDGKYCGWQIAWSYRKRLNGFLIVDNQDTISNTSYTSNMQLYHNHGIDYEVIDGITEVKSSKDLTPEEEEILKHGALMGSKMPSIKDALNTKCGQANKRIYDSQMIHRYVNAEKVKIFGPNHDRIPEFMKRGQELSRSGGNFETDVDDGFHIVGTKYQTARMIQYALQYGAYHVMVDGTFGTNKYGMTLAPWIVIDCLGFSILAGITTSLSENSIDFLASGICFGFGMKSEDENVSLDCRVTSYPVSYPSSPSPRS